MPPVSAVFPSADDTPPSDVEPPSYESVCPSTPIVITFWRFTYAHLDHETGKRYVGRRIESKSDIALIPASTSWEDFTHVQIKRSTHLFDWDARVISRFAFNVVLKVGKSDIQADAVNWDAVKQLLLSKANEMDLVISVCPSMERKPHLIEVVTCSLVKAMQRLKEACSWKR